MSWDSVPWAVGSGALHSPETARLLAYAATSGAEGVVGFGDLAVTALTVPGASVNYAPGACSILNRAIGGAQQTYMGRNPTEGNIAIAATGGSPRYDLIVARVEDPYMTGEPWSDPIDATVGPYIFTRVISNVASTTTTVTGLGLGYSAIPLARIAIPANTATITQDMITNLRVVARPRRQSYVDVAVASNSAGVAGTQNLNTGSYVTLSRSAGFLVPEWATMVKLVAITSGFNVLTAASTGNLRNTFGNGGPVGRVTLWDENLANSRTSYVMGGEMSVPSAFRGTVQYAYAQGYRTSGTGYLRADSGTTTVFQLEFLEAAE